MQYVLHPPVLGEYWIYAKQEKWKKQITETVYVDEEWCKPFLSSTLFLFFCLSLCPSVSICSE